VSDRPPDDTPLGDARTWLVDATEELGTADCPCCGKRSELYHRHLYGVPVRGLIKAYNIYRRDWFHWARTTGAPGGDGAKLEHWGLMERATRNRDPHVPGVGHWRITERGATFVRAVSTEPGCARIVGIGNRFVRWCDDLHPAEVNIRDVVGKGFDYDALRGWS
jgi:hypothetical protein